MQLQGFRAPINGFATSYTVPFPQSVEPRMRKGREVLVIDDDLAVLRLLNVALQDSGLAVTTAVNGRDALAQLEARVPDAIVLDLEMPLMDGRAFYQEIRKQGYNIPVLILSAYDARQACRDLRADAFMAKPFDPDTLMTALVELMDMGG